MLSGERSLYWKLTGRDNLEYFAALYHVPPKETNERIDRSRAAVKLSDREDDYVERYSTGMRQRLARRPARLTAMGILWRTLINALAIVVAAYVVNQLQPDAIKWGQVDYGMGELGRYLSLILTGLALGVVNAVVKPILVMVSLPITCLTLGLFIFVINALMLLLVSAIPFLGFVVNGFIVALIASVVISIVSWALSMVLPD